MTDEIEAELPANSQSGPDLKQAPAPVAEAAEASEEPISHLNLLVEAYISVRNPHNRRNARDDAKKAIARHDKAIRADERRKAQEYHDLITGGLSEREAQGTVWPEGESNG